MIGLTLSTPTLVSQSVEGTLWNIPLNIKVVQISSCSGLTKLANVVLFNLLSKYDEKTGIGSDFRLLIVSAIVREFDSGFTETMVSDEIAKVENRIKVFQSISGQTIPDDELLEDITIVSIKVVDLDVKIVARIVAKSGKFAYLEVG